MFFLGIAMMMFNSHVAMAENFDHKYFCPDYHPQKTLDLDQMMGKWYVVEIIQHKREERIHGEGIFLKVCPEIYIGRESMSDLRLVWKEPSAIFHYKIRLENPKTPGSWITSGPHNDSVTASSSFTHFTGTIQVMKAVGNHMALTFCTTQNTRSHFSVVVAREKWLSKLEIKGVNNMLNRRGLQLLGSKYTCSGSAFSKSIFLYILLLMVWKWLK